MGKTHIFLLGDSISLHYRPYLSDILKDEVVFSGKPGAAEALADINNAVFGNGGDSGMVLAYLKERCAAEDFPYAYLLLNCGLHDIKYNPKTKTLQVPPEMYAENLEGIVSLMKTQGVQTIFITTTPVDDKVHHAYLSINGVERYNADVLSYNETAQKIMRAVGVPVIDLYTFTKALGGGTYADHVHYNDETRRRQAAYIADSLREILNKGAGTN